MQGIRNSEYIPGTKYLIDVYTRPYTPQNWRQNLSAFGGYWVRIIHECRVQYYTWLITIQLWRSQDQC